MSRKITPTIREAVTRYMESRRALARTSWLNDNSVLNRFAGASAPTGNIQRRITWWSWRRHRRIHFLRGQHG
jgi:hypothetical protein